MLGFTLDSLQDIKSRFNRGGREGSLTIEASHYLFSTSTSFLSGVLWQVMLAMFKHAHTVSLKTYKKK